MHEALSAAQKRIAELESENSNLQNKIQNDDHDVMIQSRGNTIRELREKISRLTKKHSVAVPIHDLKALDSQNKELHAKVNALHDLNEHWRAKNEKVKRHYKELYDSIKITRAKTIEKTNFLLTEVVNLKAQIQENHKSNCVTMPAIKSKVLAPGRYAIDVKPVLPRIRNNREVHLDYLKHFKKSVKTLREIVEEAKFERPLDRPLASACLYTKHSQELLEYVIGTCPKYFNQRDKKHAATPLTKKKQVTFMDPCETSTNNTFTHVMQQTMHQINEPAILSTGIKGATTASGSKPRSNTKKDKTLPAKSHLQKVEVHPRNNKSSVKRKNRVDSSISYKRIVVQIVLWYLDSGYSKHMTGDRSRLRNFVKKFIGIVRFGNDHFGAIMGYGDYMIGDSVISRVKFLRSKDETLEFVIKFLKQIQVGLNKTVRFICTDNDTEFVNHDLTRYYESVDIFHQKSVPRTPQQNDVVNRQNRTLVEAARTMLIFSKSLMFL
nr:hypothetical protein [Tanacetum cinerariifolium]